MFFGSRIKNWNSCVFVLIFCIPEQKKPNKIQNLEQSSIFSNIIVYRGGGFEMLTLAEEGV